MNALLKRFEKFRKGVALVSLISAQADRMPDDDPIDLLFTTDLLDFIERGYGLERLSDFQSRIPDR